MKESNIRSALSGSNPIPESWTATRTFAFTTFGSDYQFSLTILHRIHSFDSVQD
jgi:hypothetical protein